MQYYINTRYIQIREKGVCNDKKNNKDKKKGDAFFGPKLLFLVFG